MGQNSSGILSYTVGGVSVYVADGVIRSMSGLRDRARSLSAGDQFLPLADENLQKWAPDDLLQGVRYAIRRDYHSTRMNRAEGPEKWCEIWVLTPPKRLRAGMSGLRLRASPRRRHDRYTDPLLA